MKTQQDEVSTILDKKFMEIKARNSSFSMRGFANKLDIACGALSQIIQHKRRISEDMALKLLVKLDLDQQETEIFMRPFKRARSILEGIEYQELKENETDLGFYHFAFLSLLKLDNFNSDIALIAGKLQIGEDQVQSIIDLLIIKKLVAKNNDGHLVRTSENISTIDHTTSDYLKNLHRVNLLKASDALELPIEIRDFTAMNMAIDPDKLGKAKELIRKFQDDLSVLLESGTKTEVYKLTVQLFPITKSNLTEMQ